MNRLKSSRKSSTTDTQNDAPRLLNLEEIAARRIPVENTEIVPGRAGNWYCHYCSRRYMSETLFMKHHCEPKRRAQELMSPVGQAAYGYYRDWMKLKRYSQPSSAAFLESKYYRSFLKFAQLVIDAGISKPERYIELMVAGEIMPPLWCRNEAYSVYLDWMDKLEDPMAQVVDSVSFLLDVCDREGTTMSKVFVHLGAQRIISLLRQRQLTPWLLFCSASFGQLLKTLDESELRAFNSVVNSSYWATRFAESQATITEIKTLAAEVGL